MADNIELNAGSGGSTLATDEDASGNHYQLVKLVDGTADSTTVVAVGNGVAANALRVSLASDSTGQVKLAAGSASVGTVGLNAGSNTIGAVGINAGSNLIGSVTAAGAVAHDAAYSGNPVGVAGYAVETDGTAPGTAVAEGDSTYLKADRDGRLLVNSGHPYNFNASADYASAQTNATVQAAPGAGLSNYIEDICISNGAVAGNFTLLDGSGGSVLFECYLPVNGHIVFSPRSPIKQTAATLLAFTSTSATTHAVNVSGYIAA